MSDQKRTAHYVASTHWDREWYEPFQDYRFRLVRLMDEVLDVMQAQPEFRYFHTDGQSILIEDYLEARPEREAQLRAMAGAGRLRIGPWYVMPDEFVVSGESLIRNLQLGLATSSRYGRPSRVGFVCDMFGHISQLPQILRGFGIDNAFFFRGTNDRTHGAVWRWQGADGSEVIVNRFPRIHGYTAYAYHVRKVMSLDEPFELDSAVAELLQMVHREKNRHSTPSFLLFDGSDHIEIEPETVELLRRANDKLQDVRIIHSNLEAFVEDLRAQHAHITDVFKGELRDPAEVGDDALLLHGVLSSRMYLKQANARCENELCLWAEPFAAFADALGCAYPHQFLHLAWRALITNHAHDSMCGCSLDVVHQDMMERFRHSMQIARHVATDAMRQIALRAERPAMGDKDFAVTVFNPGADDIDGPVDLTLRFPADTDALFHEGLAYEPKVSFRLYDASGAELPYQLVNQRWNRHGFRRPLRKFPGPDDRHDVDVCVYLGIPPYGYTTLVCRPAARGEPTRYPGTMLVEARTIENEYLRVRVQPNGTLSLLDKRSKQTYDDLLMFEDCADIGDGWYHGRAVNDEIFNSGGCASDVAVVANGICKATLKVTLKLDLPRCFRFERMTRSEESTPLRITNYVTLRRKSEHVEVRTVVENTIRDHRLRVLLPAGVKADTYFADSAFDVVERPIALRADNASYREMEVETKPQYTWTAVCDGATGDRGLAVVSTGLPESAVCDLPDRAIAVTLLRSFIKAFMTDGNEGGQMHGTHEFDYLIVPLGGSLPRTRLCRLGQCLAASPRCVQIEQRDLVDAPEPALPAMQSFLRPLSGRSVVTAIQRMKEQEGWIVRMFNPTDETIAETLECPQPIHSAERVDLEGRPITGVPVSGCRVTLPLNARQIVTVRLG
jgi:alpha-mannosidase